MDVVNSLAIWPIASEDEYVSVSEVLFYFPGIEKATHLVIAFINLI